MSAYNAATMRTAKHTYTPAIAALLSLGLLYVQACVAVCSFSACATSKPAAKPVAAEHGGHCHKQQPAPEPQPADDPHQCPAHDTATASLPPGKTAFAGADQGTLLVAAEPACWITASFAAAEIIATGDTHFRAPPRPPSLTILRI